MNVRGELRQRDGQQPAEVETGDYFPGKYREAAMTFMKACMDEKIYDHIMSHDDACRHPYVAAKIYLGASDWKKYLWIEHHGSLDGFQE